MTAVVEPDGALPFSSGTVALVERAVRLISDLDLELATVEDAARQLGVTP